MKFYKFDGAGNDFVIVDNREAKTVFGQEEVARICHRRFGVGADGFMTLESPSEGYDFEMVYYNSDGRVGSMCGNGGRCIAMFAHLLGLGDRLHFLAYDGPHNAVVRMNPQDDSAAGLPITAMVDLTMRDVPKSEVRKIEEVEDGYFIDTGSPHFVIPVEDLDATDVVAEGRRWRNRADLFPEGTNVDFLHFDNEGEISIRTYERGVEDETYACGTGVTACALLTGYDIVHTRTATFVVEHDENDEAFTHVVLTGPASLNFTGDL